MPYYCNQSNDLKVNPFNLRTALTQIPLCITETAGVELHRQFNSPESETMRALVAANGADAVQIPAAWLGKKNKTGGGATNTPMTGGFDRMDGEILNTPEGLIALILIDGAMMTSCDRWEEWWYGMVNMERIASLIRAFGRDTDVIGIGLVINSPGGEITAAHNVIKAIDEAQVNKPVFSHALNICASGGELVAARTTQNSCETSSTIRGSIGVYTTHVNSAERHKMWGMKLTYIPARRSIYKLDLADNQAPAEGAIQRKQDYLDELLGWMVEVVIADRDIDTDSEVFNAGVFTGAKAVELGVSHKISQRDGIAELIADLQAAHQNGYTAPQYLTIVKSKNPMATLNFANFPTGVDQTAIEVTPLTNELSTKEIIALQTEGTHALIEVTALETIDAALDKEENATAKADAEALLTQNEQLAEKVIAVKAELATAKAEAQAEKDKATALESEKAQLEADKADLETTIKGYNPNHFNGKQAGNTDLGGENGAAGDKGAEGEFLSTHEKAAAKYKARKAAAAAKAKQALA